jgi:hypothetical protein
MGCGCVCGCICGCGWLVRVAVYTGVSPKYGPFWMIKNSWTATWHDHGFVYLPRGINCANISQAGGDLFTMGDPSTYYI